MEAGLHRLEPDAIRLRTVTAVLGPCAQDVEAFRLGQRVFRGGAAGVPVNGLKVGEVRAPAAVPYYADETLNPVIPDAQFVMARHVDSTRVGHKGARNVVGLWRRGPQSIVAAYQVFSDGVGPAKLLFTLDEPVKSLSYFPSPDSPSGGLDLVTVADGETRLVGISWYHPNLFPLEEAPPSPPAPR